MKTETEEEKQQAYDGMRAELDSGDCVTINAKDEVFFCGKFLGRLDPSLPKREPFEPSWQPGEDFRNEAEMFRAIVARTGAEQYWPNIYRVNDHGNVSLLNYKGQEIRSWV